MIRGIGGKPYISLDEHLDIQGFKKLHPEICRGFALAREYAKEGTWMSPGFNIKDMSYTLNWKPIYQALEEYKALPADHPIRLNGDDLYANIKDYKTRNKFTRYLKAVLGAKDPYIYYFLWEEEGYKGCIALGYGSLYNHSKEANAIFIFDYTDDTIKIECQSDIPAGQEILVDYTGEGLRSEADLWFDPL